MVPTIGFILCAYLVYALIQVLLRRVGRRGRRRPPWRRRRLSLVSGAGVGAGCLIFIGIASLPAPSENIRFAGIVSPCEDLLCSGRQLDRQEIPPIKNLGGPGRPVYAYLHPETPPAQLTSENGAPPPRAMPRPRLLKPASHGKVQKTAAGVPKKDKAREKGKAPHKTRAPKKKPAQTAGHLTAKSG